MDNLDDFTGAYVECALWSTNDESDESGGVPMDENYGIDDIDPATLGKMALVGPGTKLAVVAGTEIAAAKATAAGGLTAMKIGTLILVTTTVAVGGFAAQRAISATQAPATSVPARAPMAGTKSSSQKSWPTRMMLR